MNLFLNKSIRFCLKSFNLVRPRISYKFSVQQIDLLSLKEQFQKHQDMIIFNELIEQSNNSVDNINYFKIFKILEENQSPIKHY
jgi:hypothetical protein